MPQTHIEFENPERLKRFIGNRIQAAESTIPDISIEQIARLIREQAETYRSWRGGRRLPPLDKLFKVSRALHQPVTFFLGIDCGEIKLSDDEQALLQTYRNMASPVRKQVLGLLHSMFAAREEAIPETDGQ